MFFISSILVHAFNRVLVWRQVIVFMSSGWCTGRHDVTHCSTYFTCDLFFPSSSIFFLKNVFVLSFIARFTFVLLPVMSSFVIPRCGLNFSFCSVHPCLILVLSSGLLGWKGFLSFLLAYWLFVCLPGLSLCKQCLVGRLLEFFYYSMCCHGCC